MTPEEKKEEKRLYDIEYRKLNKIKLSEQKKEWAKNNPDIIAKNRERNKEGMKISNKKYAERNKDKLNDHKTVWAKNNPDKVKTAKKKYVDNNRDKINQYIKDKTDNDPLFKLKANIRTSIRGAIQRKGYTKKSRTHEILGCSFGEFKEHIESQWEDWMNWNNYGKYNGDLNHGWDCDHIIPISSAINEGEVIKLNHFTNLQPLCSKTNRDIKRDLII